MPILCRAEKAPAQPDTSFCCDFLGSGEGEVNTITWIKNASNHSWNDEENKRKNFEVGGQNATRFGV